MATNSESDLTTDYDGPRKRRVPAKFGNVVVKRKKLTNVLSKQSNTPNDLSYPPSLPKRSLNISPMRKENQNEPSYARPVVQVNSPNFQKLVLSSLSTIKLRLQHVEETQEQIIALVKAVGSGRKIGVLSLGLPVTTLEELDDLEQTIRTTPEQYQEIVDRLDWVGGSDATK
ncbi:unnamed protein product [Allacma fusca]|uniref:Uncharacterized protein n=1 Tax=Allacma fusca TaxID=39272 RepID=A0A8J2P949_9HEXA|nr:unnamed protein product [Allacma fusca]